MELLIALLVLIGCSYPVVVFVPSVALRLLVSVPAIWYVLFVVHPENLAPIEGSYYTVKALMNSALAGMVAIQLSYYVTLPTHKAKLIQPKEYLWSFFYFAFQLEKNHQVLSGWKEVIVSAGTLLAIAGMKFVTCIFLFQWIIACFPNTYESPQPTSVLVQYTALFISAFIAGTWSSELQSAVVVLVTKGKYTTLSFNDYPFLSTSLRDFWGNRYNKLVSKLLRNTVFYPLKENFGISNALAAFGVFCVSGILHSYVAHFTFGRGVLPSFLFFALQGVGCWLETTLMKKTFASNPILGSLWTFSFLLATSPLYPGLFLSSGKLWLDRNPLEQPLPIPVPPICPS